MIYTDYTLNIVSENYSQNKHKGEEKRMKISETKTAISLVAVVLILTSVCIAALPKVNADNRYYTEFVYVASGIGNRPATLGDSVLLVAWTADMPPDTGEKVGFPAAWLVEIPARIFGSACR